MQYSPYKCIKFITRSKNRIFQAWHKNVFLFQTCWERVSTHPPSPLLFPPSHLILFVFILLPISFSQKLYIFSCFRWCLFFFFFFLMLCCLFGYLFKVLYVHLFICFLFVCLLLLVYLVARDVRVVFSELRRWITRN